MYKGQVGTGTYRALFTRVVYTCLLYTLDAADDTLRVDLGGRRIIKKKMAPLYDQYQHIPAIP